MLSELQFLCNLKKIFLKQIKKAYRDLYLKAVGDQCRLSVEPYKGNHSYCTSSIEKKKTYALFEENSEAFSIYLAAALLQTRRGREPVQRCLAASLSLNHLQYIRISALLLESEQQSALTRVRDILKILQMFYLTVQSQVMFAAAAFYIGKLRFE